MQKKCLLIAVLFSLGIIRALSATKEELLINVQSRIYDAFVSSLKAKNCSALQEIENSLGGIVSRDPMVYYWRAYALRYEAFFYLQNGNKNEAEKSINVAVDLLSRVENKNAEVFAFLGFLQGFSCQFAGMRAMGLAKKATANAEQALRQDSLNLRAWYVLANNDFHTPAIFSGGKKTLELIKKMLVLPEQTSNALYMPTWGRAEAYNMLVAYYIKKEDFVNAKKTLNEALNIYPNDVLLRQKKEQLK